MRARREPSVVMRPTALTPLDAAFLHVESERTPMQMASVGIFEGGPLYDLDGNFRIDEIRRLVASRLDLVPKLRQRPYNGLLGEAPPVWLDDPGFEISEHVRVCRVPSSRHRSRASPTVCRPHGGSAGADAALMGAHVR